MIVFLGSLRVLSQDLLFEKKDDPLDLRPPDVIHWTGFDCKSYVNGYILVKIDLTTEQQFRIYKEKLDFYQEEGWFFIGSQNPKSKKLLDPISNKNVEVFEKGQFTLLFKGPKHFRKDKFNFFVKYLGCTQKICLFPYEETMMVSNFVSTEELAAETVSLYTKKTDKHKKPLVQDKVPQLHLEEKLLQMTANGGGSSFFWLLLLAFLGGLLTNLTPCVYPMIPITIRLLAKETFRPIVTSSMYALGIMITYTTLGVVAVSTGSLFGSLMSNLYFNLLLALAMLILGVGMLGFGNFSYLQNLGIKIEGTKSGLMKTFFMGIGAGFVASPCTGPILASLLTYAATLGSQTKSIFLLFVYSLGFALPYILLGQISSKIAMLRVRPWVAGTTKIFFSSIIFALGFYYLRIPFYHMHKAVENHWGFILLTSLGFGITFLFLSFLIKKQYKRVYYALPTLVLGFSLFSFYQWHTLSRSINSRSLLSWSQNEDEAFLKAHNLNSPILIDMWAEWCEACKQMDVETFSNQSVIKELLSKKWVLIKADLTQSSSQKSVAIKRKYNVKGLPTIVIIPSGKNQKHIKLKGFVSAKNLLSRLQKVNEFLR